MTYDPETADTIGAILDELMDALVALEGRQDEDNDRPALELVQLVAVDVQDAIDNIDADPPHPLFDAAGELADTACWLAAYRTDQPDLVTALTTLIDDAAAKISYESIG